MHFFRALTIPVIPADDELRGAKWDTGFQRLRAVRLRWSGRGSTWSRK